MTLNYGLAVAGTIVPPDLTEFALVASLDADLDGALDLDLAASVSYNFQYTANAETKELIT